jgi:anti-sigma regulatory factor (Ser/Thr protein kinase)
MAVAETAIAGLPFPDVSGQVTVRLPRDPRCGAIARRELEKHAGKALRPLALADAKTVLVELVNNAYRHGEGAIELRLRLLSDRLRIDVIDEGGGGPIRIKDRLIPGLGGYGLRLVDSLAVRWGAGESRSHVWAEVPV